MTGESLAARRTRTKRRAQRLGYTVEVHPDERWTIRDALSHEIQLGPVPLVIAEAWLAVRTRVPGGQA